MRILFLGVLVLSGAALGQDPKNAPGPGWTRDLKVLSPVSISAHGELTFIGSDARLHRADAQGHEEWSFALGDMGRAQPVLTPGGGVIAAAYDDTVYALDAAGKLLWKQKLDGDIYATPALRPDGSVIVATAGGTVVALGSDGQTLWSHKVGSPVYSSPAIGADGTIYFGTQGNLLQALTSTGQPRWSFAARSTVFSSPALDQDGNIYFGSSDRHIYSLDPSGQLRWERATGMFVNASPIVTDDGLVVVGSYDGVVYALKTSGQDAWTYAAGAGIAAPAAELSDGTVVVGDLNGTLHAIGRSGQALWTRPTGRKIDTGVAVSDAGTLYYSLSDGTLNADPGGRPLAVGPWTTFRAVASGWGRSLQATELAALKTARQAATQAVLMPLPASQVTLAPTAQEYARAAAAAATVRNRLIYVPLTASAGALGWKVLSISPQSAFLQSGMVKASVPVTFAGQPLVPLAALTALPGTVTQMQVGGAGIKFTRSGQDTTLPLDLLKLLPFAPAPELAAPPSP